MVPFVRGESPNCLFTRRDEAARSLYHSNRDNVYCTWRKAVVNLHVKDTRWEVFRESLVQKRSKFKSIQLVTTRFTCTQWRGNESCRNCSNRQWRTACLCPVFLHHIMPLAMYRNREDQCEQCLSELDVTSTDFDGTQWANRVPQLNVR